MLIRRTFKSQEGFIFVLLALTNSSLGAKGSVAGKPVNTIFNKNKNKNKIVVQKLKKNSYITKKSKRFEDLFLPTQIKKQKKHVSIVVLIKIKKIGNFGATFSRTLYRENVF